MNIEGLKAVVTGGASGLGLATAEMLTNNGADVTVFDIDGSIPKRAAVKSVYARFIETDVSDEAAVIAAFEEVTGKGEPARILVNCAGVAPSVRMFRYEGLHPVDVFRHTVDVNLAGTFIPIAKFAERLRGTQVIDGECGVIINTSSIVAFDGQEGHVAYAASKAGIAGMTLPLARLRG